MIVNYATIFEISEVNLNMWHS